MKLNDDQTTLVFRASAELADALTRRAGEIGETRSSFIRGILREAVAPGERRPSEEIIPRDPSNGERR